MANDNPNFEKKYIHRIGVPGLPLPVLRNVLDDKGKVVGKDLSTVESYDEGYTLRSSRASTAEVMGHLIRNLPVRGMLPALEYMLKRGDIKQADFTAFLRAGAGVGKTHLARTYLELRDPRGPLVTDIGGQSMENLLYRIIFNAEEKKTLMQMVDEALAANTLNPISMKALELLGKGFDKDSTPPKIDWTAVAADEKATSDTVNNALAAVFKLQSWDSKLSNIGFKIEEGAIIKADMDNRDLLVDEVNKSLPDSETPLQIVAQVLNGETKRHSVSMGGKGNYELVNGHESGKGNMVLFTGNMPKDGTGTRQMSDSWNRRIPPYDISDFTVADWQDRTAQILTGMPMLIMHRLTPGSLKKDKWEVNDPKVFTETLLTYSTFGMTEGERLRVKDWQTSMLTHWETVMPQVEKLGEFYHKWEQLVDRDSPLLKGGKFPDIMMEVDDDLMPVEKVTASTMIRHINDAQAMTPQARPAAQSGGFSLKSNWDVPLQMRKLEPEPVSKNFGTRLVASIMEEIERTTLQKGKKGLYKQLMEDAKEAGLIGNPPPLAQALNIDPSKDKEAQAKTVQTMLCTQLRKQYPGSNLPDDDEAIMPLSQVAAQLDVFRNAGRDVTISPFTTELLVTNTDMQTNAPFKRVAADSGEKTETIDEVKKRLPTSDLLDMENLLTSLALPVIGRTNMDALWNKALTGGGFSPNEKTSMAQAASDDSGLSITTLLCKGNADKADAYVPLHVIRNSKTHRTMIVGDAPIDDALYDRLKRNKIVYINRQFEGADVWVNTEIRGMVESQFEQALREAFLLRNKAAGGKTDAPLSQLLSDASLTTPDKPNFITNLDPSAITHAQRYMANKGDVNDVMNQLM